MRWCRRRPACYFPQTQTPRSHALSTVIRQKASDLRKHCARGETRTAFQPVQIVGTPENISAPSQSGRYATQSEAKSVDSVNTSFCLLPLEHRSVREGAAAPSLPQGVTKPEPAHEIPPAEATRSRTRASFAPDGTGLRSVILPLLLPCKDSIRDTVRPLPRFRPTSTW